MLVLSYPKNSLLFLFYTIMLHFGFDHFLNGQYLGHHVCIIDFIDLISQQHTLFFCPFCQLFNLIQSLLCSQYIVL